MHAVRRAIECTVEYVGRTMLRHSRNLLDAQTKSSLSSRSRAITISPINAFGRRVQTYLERELGAHRQAANRIGIPPIAAFAIFVTRFTLFVHQCPSVINHGFEAAGGEVIVPYLIGQRRGRVKERLTDEGTG